MSDESNGASPLPAPVPPEGMGQLVLYRTPPRTVAKFATVQTEGARSVAREIEFYRLEVKRISAAKAKPKPKRAKREGSE